MRQNKLQIRVNYGDTDMAGIVYYPNYFKWFDIAAHQFFRNIGMPPAELQLQEQIVLPILDVHCTFEKALFYDDIISIHTEVMEINHKTFKLKHELYRDQVRAGHGYELRGWVKQVNEHKMMAVPIPENVQALFKSEQSSTQEQNNPWLNA